MSTLAFNQLNRVDGGLVSGYVGARVPTRDPHVDHHQAYQVNQRPAQRNCGSKG